ncbi:hypothetical protein CAPTEDRAFT_109949 [Capitella teleta]|uniref:Rho-GAP domain-containing protein n=1 Tax=Capitella teleta TaxID=283909 RepID=R7TEU1_CAPTE|nr:hypothetical protein CAPTEDRAFT_109949 [Capitella teleta]|eukprot:ELT92268.1 hypothetical protein CAPTEDRAFT_109949 [Capitella teleta]
MTLITYRIPPHFTEENTKRPKKTKRSPIINFFRRSQVKLDDSSTTPTGKLFGHPLSDVCQDDDSLPKPLLELLKYLFISAPFTTGVFRKPGNHKRMQEVRCRMDQGEEIQWDDVPVLVATSILKEYLRSLPVCLLLCELFEQWVELMNISDLDERKTVIIKFLQRLPSVHLCFLRHMMCVFYHIMQRSDENHMAAQALAVCISPSLLWQNDTFATGNAMADTMRHTAKSEKARKLFQFMLEHIIEIFGRDVIYLFGELPSHPSMQSKCRQDSSTDSDSMHSMLSAPENTGECT